jgi:hypothetical protein
MEARAPRITKTVGWDRFWDYWNGNWEPYARMMYVTEHADGRIDQQFCDYASPEVHAAYAAQQEKSDD